MARKIDELIQRRSDKFEHHQLREYEVVKANALIQKTRYDLTLQEQKLILFVVQKIKPGDKEFKKYIFSIQEYCQVCEITDRSGQNYSNVKKSLKALRDKSFWMTIEDGSESLMSWLSKVRISEKKGTIEVQLDDDLKPYLLELKSFFTRYKYLYVMAMRSSYSIRLYEVLKSYENQGGIILTLKEIREMLYIEKGKLSRWSDLKRRVIDQAQKEINELTDIQIRYETVKEGRSVNEVGFYVYPKVGKQLGVAQMHVEKRLKKVKDEPYPF